MAGSIRKYKNNTYRLEYMYEGKRYSKTIHLDKVKENYKNDAKIQKELSDFIQEVQNGYVKLNDCTFTQYAQLWLDNVAKPNLSTLTVNKYISNLNNRILPYLRRA